MTGQQKKPQRTERVCDRCRIKKQKCNGGHCQACIKSGSACLYTHPRRRTSKSDQCQMPDIMSVGLHKMYLACKQNSCFPGPLPDRDDENVSIHDILRCLGLIANPHDLQLDSSRTNLQGDGAKKKDNKEDEPSTTQDMLSSAPLLSSTSTTNSPFSALPEDITVNFSDGLFPGLYY